MTASAVGYAFIETIPDRLEPATVYVSLTHRTALHLCACGCRTEVVTPIGRGEWTLAWDGETVSLHPSVGNARLACRSHYWIRRGTFEWVAGEGGQALAATERQGLLSRIMDRVFGRARDGAAS